MRVISEKKTPKILLEEINIKELWSSFKFKEVKKTDKEIKKTYYNIKRANFLSLRQYINLFWEKPILNSNFSFYKQINWNELNNEILITTKWNIIPKFKINHIYKNNENIANINKDIKWNIIFDQNIKFKINNGLNEEYLLPDWIIFKENKIYFIETDLWKERDDILRKKWEYYKNYLTQEYNLWKFEYSDIQILFFTTTTKKINTLIKNKVFYPLELLSLIHYSLNW